MSEVGIAIKIKIKGQTLELSMEEARTLAAALEVFADDKPVVVQKLEPKVNPASSSQYVPFKSVW